MQCALARRDIGNPDRAHDRRESPGAARTIVNGAIGNALAFQYNVPTRGKIRSDRGNRPMSGIGRLAATLILGIVLPGARAEAQNTSLMEMNMDMGAC